MGKKEYIRLPIGIIILIIATCIELLRESYSFFTHNAIFFGFYTTGIFFYIINSIFVLISISVLIFLIRLIKKMFYPTICYFTIMIVNYIATIINHKYLASISNTNPVEIILIHSFGILLFLITIWYLFEKKTLFFTKKDDNKSIEKYFIGSYIFIFIVVFILSIYF